MNYFLLFFLIFIVSSCSQDKLSVRHIHGEAQGTTYNITYISEKNISKQSIDSILKVIDLSMSNYIDNSLITRINNNEILPIDDHFKTVFLASKQVYSETDGYFDPSIGSLIEAWGFGKKEHHLPPSQQQIDSLLLLTGLHKIELNSDNVLEKQVKNIQLNFNAIAQGYTADVLANYLLINKIENFIVEMGGEIYVNGNNIISQKPWLIGIDNPLQKPDEPRSIIAKSELKNSGLATSGNYRKVWTDSLSGKKYVHTLNPKTGLPEQSNLLSATIVAPSAMLADAYATAFMAMGIEKTKKILSQHPEIKALLLYHDENFPDKIQQYTTPNFKVIFD